MADTWFDMSDGPDYSISDGSNEVSAKAYKPISTGPDSIGYLNIQGRLIGELFALTRSEKELLDDKHGL